MSDRTEGSPPISFWLQLLIGAACGVGISVVLLILGLLGVPLTLPVWIGVFAVIWVTCFLCLKFNLRACLIGFMATIATSYALFKILLIP